MTDILQTSEITIIPDPQILQVLTYLEMRPIDSLCELIDNSIDALMSMQPEHGPLVAIELPSKREVEDGTARIRIRDNGPGMTLDQVENSLRAGYSSKQRLGSLGLFGVGFNIATGKLGRVTRLLTARAEDEFAIEAIVDLVDLKKSGNFKVKATKIEKPAQFIHGTLVDVSQPWGKGNQNFDYMLKLVSLGRPKTLAQLGRTYATLLRDKRARIMVGEDTVEPYAHCVWDDSRFVEHAKRGKISSIFRFANKVIHTYKKCTSCGATIPDQESACPTPACNCSSFTSQEERISGWVGVQRYLDASHYGIDLIRNGRAIRVLEKEAFFNFQDPDSGDPVVDYPIDNREGRIVGEIHLDHVPVDPAKQNFERSSPEWRRAIEFLRGQSSLQPERPGADSNASPVFWLYQGYRKVRTPGKRSMTMGKWLPGSSEPRALSKSEIDELKDRFEKREPGYFDDSEWWKLVEQADNKPVAGLRKCPSCFLESPDGVDECPNCGYIFEGKHCINSDCNSVISRSAVICSSCGSNQIPEISEPWICEVCTTPNSATDAVCVTCGFSRGALNPVSEDALKGTSQRDDHLSVNGLSISLADAKSSSPIDISTFRTVSALYSYHFDGTKVRVPSVRFISDNITIFIDPTHPLFELAGLSLEQQVAMETAAFLFAYYNAVATKNPSEHTITKIAHDVLQKVWPEKFSPLNVGQDLESLFSIIKQKLADCIATEGPEVYNNLPNDERTALSAEIVRLGRDMSELASLKDSGKFVQFVRARGLLEIFKINPRLFFDGKVWDITYAGISSLDSVAVEQLQQQIKNQQSILLEIAVLYIEKGINDAREADMAKSAYKLLSAKLVG
jgi:hypothetical protein